MTAGGHGRPNNQAGANILTGRPNFSSAPLTRGEWRFLVVALGLVLALLLGAVALGGEPTAATPRVHFRETAPELRGPELRPESLAAREAEQPAEPDATPPELAATEARLTRFSWAGLLGGTAVLVMTFAVGVWVLRGEEDDGLSL